MVTQEQIKGLQDRIVILNDCLDIDKKRSEVSERELQSQASDFWDDPKKAEAFLKESSAVKAWVTAFDSAKSAVDDVEVLMELDPEGFC